MLRSIRHYTMPKVFSDHKPIFLESGDWETLPSSFKFENMWIQEEGFINMIKDGSRPTLYKLPQALRCYRNSET